MLRDLKFSIRTLRRQPAPAAVIIVTLALGIGATTAIFSILNAVLIQELPYNDPDRLYMLRRMDQGRPDGLMAPRFVDPLLEGHPEVEAATFGWVLPGSILATDGTPHPFLPYRATHHFFEVFNGPMAMGRGFQSDEFGASIVISHATWENYLNSDPDILGKSVVVDGSPRTVIGVTREGFEFPEGAGSWQLVPRGPTLQDLTNYEAYLRLREDVDPERFAAGLPALSAELGPIADTGEPMIYVLKPLLEEVVGEMGTTTLILAGATAVLLLIACLNVANLLLARSNARAHEIGLREAVGAGRLRILRQLVTESLLVSAIGGILGLALAFTALRLLLAIGPADLPRLAGVRMDTRVLAFSVGLVVLTSLLVGLAPALRLGRTQVRALISRGGRGGSTGRAENRVFGALVVAEIGLAVVLVVGAGLLLRSYVNLVRTDPGFDARNILTVRLNATHVPTRMTFTPGPDGEVQFTGSGYEGVISFFQELSDRIGGLAGVVDVANGQELPLYLNTTSIITPEPFVIGGRPGEQQPVRIRPVSANLFDFFGTRMLAGRGMEATDTLGAPGVALVNAAFSTRYFQDSDPVGQRLEFLRSDDVPGSRGWSFNQRLQSAFEVVGVVSDIPFVRLSEAAVPYVFISEEQFITRVRALAVRTDFDDPASLIPAIRAQVAEMAPTVPVEFAVYENTVRSSIARERLGAALLAVCAGIALALAAVGTYGVMAYSVGERTGEIAVRTALGASSGQVLGLIMRRGVRLGAAGVALGLLATVALRQVVAGQLYGVSALDPAVMILVGLALLGVALAASFIPARRASRVEPMTALRQE